MGVFNKTIIPLKLVGYEMIIANSMLRALVEKLLYIYICPGFQPSYISSEPGCMVCYFSVSWMAGSHTRMLGVSKHIDECATGLIPQFTIFPFCKILSSAPPRA